MTQLELIQHDKKLIEDTVNATLEKLGMIKTTYTRAEVERLYGRRKFEKSLIYVKWVKKGKSKNSPVICQKEDFENYISRFNQELKRVVDVL